MKPPRPGLVDSKQGVAHLERVVASKPRPVLNSRSGTELAKSLLYIR